LKKLFFAVALLLIIAIIAGGYWWYMDRDRRLVVELIRNVAGLVEKKSGDLPHAGVFKFVKIDELFDKTVVLRCQNPAIEAAKRREELKGRIN
jgi:hypothetical protein